MIPIILRVVDWLIKNFKVVAVSIILLLSAISFYKYNQLQDKKQEIDRLQNNIDYYQNAINDKTNQNTVLQLTIDELSYSKDSLINEVKAVQKKLKVKDKNLTNINVINTEIKDSIKTVIKTVEKNFTEELKLNQLTTIIVSRQDSILKAKIDLQNQQILFVEEKKVYKKQYKNGFIRFLHFDWRKRRVKKYQIHNTNELIKITDTRIIEVTK